MSLKLTNDQTKEILRSIERYFREELECEIGEMQAGFALDYFLAEIAPFAYNQGVEDARSFFQDKLEDLPGTCFKHGLTYWEKRKKKGGGGLPSHD